MIKKSGIYWLLAVIAFFILPLLAAAADKTVYLPIIGGNATTYKIGDRGPAGGFVFFVHTDGQHGLEAAPADQSIGKQWYNSTYTDTEAHGDGIGAGEMNTTLIIANQGSDSNSYAAGLCANSRENPIDAYGDWYLPSGRELLLMFRNLHSVGKGGFADGTYWSSTESESDFKSAHYVSFITGLIHAYYKNYGRRVRCVRAF